MANKYYENSDTAQRFQPGTTVGAASVDAKFDGVESGFESTQVDTDRAIKFPAEAGVSQELNVTAINRRRKVIGFDQDGSLTLQSGFSYRGDWTTATEYFVNEFFRDGATKNLYVVVVGHTSTSVSADLAAGKLTMAVNVADVEAAKDIAESAANFKGKWINLTGAISKPACVFHSSKYWFLLNNLADITLSEPGVSVDWLEGPISGAFDDAVTSADQGWSSQKIQNTLNNATSTGANKTLVNGERCFVTAPGLTITLPAAPAVNTSVSIGVGAFTDTVVARNGSNIMGLAENLIIDKENAVVTLLYVNATEGWRIIS